MTLRVIDLDLSSLSSGLGIQFAPGLLVFFPLGVLIIYSLAHMRRSRGFDVGIMEASILLGAGILGLLPPVMLPLISSLSESLDLSMNIGGFLVPLVFATVLLVQNLKNIVPALLGVALVACMAFFLVEPNPEITQLSFLDILLLGAISVVVGRVLGGGGMGGSRDLVLTSGIIGTFIGADLIPIVAMRVRGELIQGTMGGGGPLDAIFLVGLLGFAMNLSLVHIWKNAKGHPRDGSVPQMKIEVDVRPPIDGPKDIPSDLKKRARAASLDYLLVWSLAMLVVLTFGPRWQPSEGIFSQFLATTIMWSLPALLLYHVLFELLWDGMTPGKRVNGLMVVDTEGMRPTMVAVLTRNIYRIIEMILLFIPSAVMVLTNEKRQRIGDLLGDTMVVEGHDEDS